MRDQKSAFERRLTDFSGPFDAALSLLGGAPTDEVLKGLVMRMGEGLGAVSGSLSLLREKELRPVILHGLQREPLFSITESGRPLAAVIAEGSRPLVFVSGDPGPLAQILDKSGGKITSIVTIPVRTPVTTLGLACFYLPPESAAPRIEATEHLERWGGAVALALETAANRVARERLSQMERIGLVGRLAEQAILEMGPPLDRLFATIGRLRTEHDLRGDNLLAELRGMGTELTRAKRYRDTVLGFMAGQPASVDLIQLAPVFHGVRAWTAESLERHSIRLEATEPAATDSSAGRRLPPALGPRRSRRALRKGALRPSRRAHSALVPNREWTGIHPRGGQHHRGEDRAGRRGLRLLDARAQRHALAAFLRP